MAVVVKTIGVPWWGVVEFTTHFGTYCSGDWDWDVHSGYLLLTPGKMDI